MPVVAELSAQCSAVISGTKETNPGALGFFCGAAAGVRSNELRIPAGDERVYRSISAINGQDFLGLLFG